MTGAGRCGLYQGTCNHTYHANEMAVNYTLYNVDKVQKHYLDKFSTRAECKSNYNVTFLISSVYVLCQNPTFPNSNFNQNSSWRATYTCTWELTVIFLTAYIIRPCYDILRLQAVPEFLWKGTCSEPTLTRSPLGYFKFSRLRFGRRNKKDCSRSNIPRLVPCKLTSISYVSVVYWAGLKGKND